MPIVRCSRRNALVVAAALALAGTGAARAFTLTDQNGNTGPAQGYVDLDPSASRHDQATSRFGTEPSTTLNSGNSTVKFYGGATTGGGSFNQRYNPSNLYDPYMRDGR